MTNLHNWILDSASRLAMPIGVYSGLEFTGATVKEAVTSSRTQTEAILAIHEHFSTSFLQTAMDLSVEAEAFGCQVSITDNEIPNIIGRRTTCLEEINRLGIPEVGIGRTQIPLETAAKLVAYSTRIPVLGGVIGPFSLAGRIFGVSEILELSISEPDSLHRLLEKTTHFLNEYVLAFRKTGAAGVIMAEPAAGLLSPRSMAQFSSPYVKQILENTENDKFSIILHNCGAKLVHLPIILGSGAKILHFGAPMDMLQALQQVSRDVIVCGNLNPTSVFFSGTLNEVFEQTTTLLKLTHGYDNFVLSSGCDIPPHTPIQNLEAFYSALLEINYVEKQ